MASNSKRDLYHAASKTVGRRKKKPLTQGRLVLGESVQPSPKPLAQGQPTKPKPKDDAQDPTISPIKSVPTVTEDTFPLAEPPSECLDLSDADDSESALQPPVLLCDASHLGVSPDGAEVDVIIVYEPSPVKVVCHTPGKLSQAARPSPAVRSSKKINGVDQGQLNVSQSNSLLAYKESPRLASGRRELAFLKELSALEKPHFDESAENTPTKSSTAVTSALEKLDPESDTCSLNEYVSPKMASGNDKLTLSKMADNVKDVKPKEAPVDGQLKKGKSYRVVNSRYMQPSLNKTINVSKGSSASTKDSSGHQKSSTRAASNEKLLPKSGNSSKKSVDRKTSTPTFDEKSHYLDDISAIHSASTMSFNLGGATSSHQQDAPQTMYLPKPADMKQPKARGKMQTKPSGVAKTKSELEANALELDFAYTRYLQWTFLNLKAKKAVADQDASAISELNGLWKLLESQKEELSNTKSEVSKLKQTLLAEEVLEKSEQELSTAASSLPVEQYSTLSSALDTTRHQLPVKDIFMPEGDSEREKLEHEMGGILSESGEILKDIKDLIGGKNDQLSQYADSLKTVDKCYSETCAELRDAGADLDSVQTLTTHMTSLFVQGLQAGDQSYATI